MLVQQRILIFKIQLIILFDVIYRLLLVRQIRLTKFFKIVYISIGAQNSYRILLDKLENISLAPREKFHIPIAFCPETLARQEAQLRIIGRLPAGKTWSPDK